MADTMLNPMSVSVFCGSVAMMLRSGVTTAEACALFAQDNSGDTASAAREIASAMDSGEPFADAAEKTGVFPGYALGVFRTAELSGRLDEAMERLADYYERQQSLNEHLRSTLTYPVALMLMMCVVLSVLVFWVLPMFEKVYGSLAGSLAASGYGYVAAAAVIGRVSLVAAMAVSAALLVLAWMLRTDRGRKSLQQPMERSRLTKEASRNLAVSNFADTLSTLLASGTDPDTAVQMAAELTDHQGVKTMLTAVISDMQTGEGLADSLFRHKVFPALYGRMLVGGDRTGNLADALKDLSNRLGRDAENRLTAVIDNTEPVLIGFLTVSVGLTLLSVMLPLLGILGAV